MKRKAQTSAPTTTCEETLTILREVSDIYQRVKVLRKRVARAAKDEGHPYQALSEALNISRTGAYNLVNRDADAA